MAMAIKAAFGDEGFSLWDQWSRGSEKYRPADAKSVWRSIHAKGGIGLGTLLWAARRAGYTGNLHGKGLAWPMTPRPPTGNAGRLGRQEGREKAGRRAAGAVWKAVQWNKQVHPYWARKGFPELLWPVSKSLRVIDGLPLAGCIVIPVRDIAGQLLSVQFIAPNGDRRFLPGGRTSVGMFVLGQLEHAPVVLVCEGAATAMSLHTATRYAVAAALSAGNLLRVSTAIRSALPDAQLLLCADDDPTGTAAAAHAAVAAGGIVVMPPFATPQRPGADFNDLHLQEGLSAVAAVVLSALPNHN